MDTIEKVQKIGYAVVENVLSESEIKRYREKLLDLFEEEGRINPRFSRKPPQYFVNNIAARSRVFDPLIEHPLILEVGEVLLGKNFILSEVRACNVEKCPESPFIHRDGHFPTLPDHPLAVIGVWTIDPYSKENGATIIYPGSHYWPYRPTPEITKYFAPLQVAVPAGSLFFFNANIWHGPAGNPTGNSRWGLFNVYTPWTIKPYFDATSRIPLEDFRKLSPKMKELLGFTSIPPSDETKRIMTTVPIDDVEKHFQFKI